MTSFSFETTTRPGGEHTDVRIYAGPDEEHRAYRAYAGTLTFRTHEAQDFVHRLFQAGESIEELIEQSSLGAPGAKALRTRTPPEVARAIVQRSKELDEEGQPLTDRDRDPRCWCNAPAGMPHNTQCPARQ